MKKEIKSVSAKNDLDFYYNAKNFPDQDFIFTTIDYFATGQRKDFFNPLEFMNLFWKQHNFIVENISKPYSVITTLKNLPLTNEQKHILFGFILKWFGGYPINNLNEQFKTTLKLVEKEFLNFENDTPEKLFCKTDKEFKTQLKDLENLSTNNFQVLLSGGKFHNVEFDFDGLPNWIIVKRILGKYQQTTFGNENDYSLWKSDLIKFIESVPEKLKEKTINKGIEYGKMLYDFHFKNECSDPSYCPYDQCWIRRITLAENLLIEILANNNLEPKTIQTQIDKKKFEPVTIDLKPVFKPEIVQTIFDILKDYFPNDQQITLRDIINSGCNSDSKLLFKANGNRLTDTFKKLIEHDFIVGCQKQDLISWVISNFNYLKKDQLAEFKTVTTEKSISGNNYNCKSPLIQIENGQIIKVDLPRRKKYSKY